GLSFPAAFDAAGLPIGLQLVGRPFDEETILRVARAYEREHDAASRAPAIATGEGGGR
ncbi:MAG TPA: Asp-tRNA(Asn)/Glu-tRNA(Gln) amidotransferase GatCAB subunit A, partial [Candidatus Eisenbacteria bacterium]|nr:Asp-tRNA(Asn)/Glu-tRNA(Gln) amidotransferase GatCAB subunit A [Candidatus Eisenbacteria bacterium]